jgi:uncharacterized protein (DUF433 family)
VVTADRLELISTDPWGMHGQASFAGTRVPVSVILDCRPAPAREELLPLPQSRRRDDE